MANEGDSTPRTKLLMPRWRWTQFSLGTMFVVVTVLCVWMGFVVNWTHRQRHAMAAIERGWERRRQSASSDLVARVGG
jgi:hypothetical protein